MGPSPFPSSPPPPPLPGGAGGSVEPVPAHHRPSQDLLCLLPPDSKQMWQQHTVPGTRRLGHPAIWHSPASRFAGDPEVRRPLRREDSARSPRQGEGFPRRRLLRDLPRRLRRPAVLAAPLPIPAPLLLHEPLFLRSRREFGSPRGVSRGLGGRREPRLRSWLGLLDGRTLRWWQPPRGGRRGLWWGFRHRHRWADKVRRATSLAGPYRAHRFRRHPVSHVHRGGHRQLSRARRCPGPGSAAPASVSLGRRDYAPGAHDVPAKAPHSAILVGPEGAPSLWVEAHAQEVARRVGSGNDPILCGSWLLVEDRRPLAGARATRREARQARELYRVVVRSLFFLLVFLVVLVGSPSPAVLSRDPSLPLAFAGWATVFLLWRCTVVRRRRLPLLVGCSKRRVTVRSLSQSEGSTCRVPASPGLPPPHALGPPDQLWAAQESASEGGWQRPAEGPDSGTEAGSDPASKTERARPLTWLESSVPAARAGACVLRAPSPWASSASALAPQRGGQRLP